MNALLLEPAGAVVIVGDGATRLGDERGQTIIRMPLGGDGACLGGAVRFGAACRRDGADVVLPPVIRFGHLDPWS